MSTTTTTTTTTASELVPGCRAFQGAEGSHGLPVVPALLVPGAGSQPCAEGDGRHESIRERGAVECNGPGPRQLVSEIIVGREAVKVFFVCAVLGTNAGLLCHGAWIMAFHGASCGRTAARAGEDR